MQVLYTFSGEAQELKVALTEENSTEFDREAAERKARSIADRGGYARVVFGGQTLAEYGEDPRHI